MRLRCEGLQRTSRRYQQAWNAFAALPPKTAEAAEAAAADDADDAAAAGNLSSYGVFPVVTETPEVQRWEPETVRGRGVEKGHRQPSLVQDNHLGLKISEDIDAIRCLDLWEC